MGPGNAPFHYVIIIMKKILIIIIVLFIALSGFFTGFFGVGLACIYAADENTAPEGYTQVSSNNQLGEAFLAYCKSRDSEITSSVVGASATAAYDSLAKFCRFSGFNVADLQSHLWYLSESNQPTKWFFDSTGINLYNQAFAYLIQEHDLEVGDPADVDLYDGDYFIDDNGNTCLVYKTNYSNNSSTISFHIDKSYITQYGSPYVYDNGSLWSMVSPGEYTNLSFNIFGRTYSGNYTYFGYGGNGLGFSCKTVTADKNPFKGKTVLSTYDDYWVFSDGGTIYGNAAIVSDSSGNLYVGIIGFNQGWRSYDDTKFNFKGLRINKTPTDGSETTVNNVIVNFTTNNNVINNNNYEGDTIINDYGDTINIYPDNDFPYNPYPDNPNYDPNDPQPGNVPDSQDPNINVPTDPSTPDLDDPDLSHLNLPDLDLPKLVIPGLKDKFPFSIPWDLAAFYAFLDAPPEAPRFQGTLDLTIYQWNYDIDFSSFDTAAALCRKLQFGLFVVGLIVATRSLIRG